MADFASIKADAQKIIDTIDQIESIDSALEGSVQQPQLDDLAATISTTLTQVQSLQSNEQIRVDALKNWGGTQPDPNPTGPGGLGATLGQTETNPTPDFEDGPAQAVAQALAAEKAATFTKDVADAVAELDKADADLHAAEFDAGAGSDPSQLPGTETPVDPAPVDPAPVDTPVDPAPSDPAPAPVDDVPVVEAPVDVVPPTDAGTVGDTADTVPGTGGDVAVDPTAPAVDGGDTGAATL